jgi:hypothetical protein
VPQPQPRETFVVATPRTGKLRFIHAIAVNMENGRLWKDSKYDYARWSCGNHLPRDQNEDDEFWEHIEMAGASVVKE